MSKITPFDFKGRNVRVVQKDGEPWFVAKDVCLILGLNDPSRAVNGHTERGETGLDEDEKGTPVVHTPGGKQRMLCINESGLYSLIFKSIKPEAKVFRKWVTSEVLPAIRKNGSYSTKPLSRADLARMVLQQEEEKKDLRECVDLIKPNVEYGSPGKNGVPRLGLRRSTYVAQAVRSLESAKLHQHIAKLQLELSIMNEGENHG
jgi:prophage antirepressor-like protein